MIDDNDTLIMTNIKIKLTYLYTYAMLLFKIYCLYKRIVTVFVIFLCFVLVVGTGGHC